jgi:flavorubredoxin
VQQPTLIRNDVYWLGTPNPDLRVFDIVMRTPFGTSYNSYLIKDAKTAVIDIVKQGFWKQYEQSLRSLVDPSQIDYIVVQHAEPDHSGCLPGLLAVAPNAVVVGSKAAIRLAEQICNCELKSLVVKDGDEIDLGGRRLRFISAPFLHWPDTIFTYSPSDRILFTCDFLGGHFWDGNLWLSRSADHDASFKYYYDAIMSPFKPYVLQALEKISSLEIDLVAPSHGPLIDHDIDEFVQHYYDWSKAAAERGSRSRKKIVVAECSAYANTRLLGDALLNGINSAGDFDIERFDLQSADPAAVVSALETADGFLVGSPTFNRDAVSVVWRLLGVVPAVSFRGMPAAAYGSYGWSGEAVGNIEKRLGMLNFKVIEDGPRAVMVPSKEDLDKARQFGVTFGASVGGDR